VVLVDGSSKRESNWLSVHVTTIVIEPVGEETSSVTAFNLNVFRSLFLLDVEDRLVRV